MILVTGGAGFIGANFVLEWLAQRDEAVIGQLLMLGAQAPAGRRVALHARAQALVQQDGAGIERRAANKANMLFEGNV